MKVRPPETEGIKYAGSKLKLLPDILRLIENVRPRIILDGFSGTTRVSQALASSGYQVISNDTAVWSEVIATCYLMSPHPRQYYGELITHLNSIVGKDGWFTEHYGGNATENGSSQLDGLKRPWQRHNTRRLDAIREEIDALKLSAVDKAVALTSLIRALDAVDSTLGHFVSYLREWSPRSYNNLQLEIPRIITKERDHMVSKRDIFDLVRDVEVDLAYFDPPYGSNNEKMPPSRVRYSSYYHLWTTICLNDRPELFGKAQRRADTSDTVCGSVFEEFRQDENGHFIAVKAIGRLLRETRAKYIVLSYSSGGRATAAELDEVIRNVGTLVELVELDYKKNVMADMRWTNEWLRDADNPNREFLFLIKK
ncbi:MAG TPA: DNA adenine methylase [Candidatus Acidoferrum sp.]|nr:DNA adenine methylase [Candidatus Acidoferrum sp.]